MVEYMTHMQNMDFKFKFKLCIMYLMVKVYTLPVYKRLILNIPHLFRIKWSFYNTPKFFILHMLIIAFGGTYFLNIGYIFEKPPQD